MPDDKDIPEGPPDFFQLPLEKQQEYMKPEAGLPEDLPQTAVRGGLRSLPSIGGFVATQFAPEITWPARIATQIVLSGLGGGAGSAIEQEAYRGLRMHEAPTTRLEEL